jgi:hypothetical protein
VELYALPLVLKLPILCPPRQVEPTLEKRLTCAACKQLKVRSLITIAPPLSKCPSPPDPGFPVCLGRSNATAAGREWIGTRQPTLPSGSKPLVLLSCRCSRCRSKDVPCLEPTSGGSTSGGAARKPASHTAHTHTHVSHGTPAAATHAAPAVPPSAGPGSPSPSAEAPQQSAAAFLGFRQPCPVSR